MRQAKQQQRYLIRGAVALISCGARIMHPANHLPAGEAMKNFILVLAIVCAGAYVVFLSAAKEAADGPNWASDVCKVGRSFCHDPQLLVYVAAGLAALWLIAVFVSAIRN
jgi:hypothetical protein